jgi:hypothetical protein
MLAFWRCLFVETYGFSGGEKSLKKIIFYIIGKKYNVSDNAIRKWCKEYDISWRK